MAREEIEITGLEAAYERVVAVSNRARDPLPTPVAHEIRSVLQAGERRRFSSGKGWRKLTPRWVAYKRSHGFDTRKLVKTGELERTLTRGGAGLKWVASKYQIVFGLVSSREYNALAKVRRPVMADRPSRQAIRDIVQNYIGQGHRR